LFFFGERKASHHSVPPVLFPKSLVTNAAVILKSRGDGWEEKGDQNIQNTFYGFFVFCVAYLSPLLSLFQGDGFLIPD